MPDIDIGLRHVAGITMYGCMPKVSADLAHAFKWYQDMMGYTAEEMWPHHCIGDLKKIPANENAKPGWIGDWLTNKFVQYPIDEAPEWLRAKHQRALAQATDDKA